MTYQTDIWQVGIVKTPITRFIDGVKPPLVETLWLPPQLLDFQFIADPFGLWRDDYLYLFVEAYDYRTKRGYIRGYVYNRDFLFIEQFTALKEPWHLSYPFLIEEEGETYMLPEAHESGALYLYRVTDFPRGWEKVGAIMNQPAIDASVIRHDGKWWMFYALPGPGDRAMKELHIACADTLPGPWVPHAGNPVRKGKASSRMGGTPFLHAGKIYLPVQDCRKSYGGAVSLLRIDRLSSTEFIAEPVTTVTPEGWNDAYRDGLHTLSACGEITLLDVKTIDNSKKRCLIDLKRRFRRLFPE